MAEQAALSATFVAPLEVRTCEPTARHSLPVTMV